MIKDDYLTYEAIFERASDGYNVSFPDIPGCYTCGDDFTEAFENARDALTLMIVDMIGRGVKIPKIKHWAAINPGSEMVEVKTYNLSKYKKHYNVDWSFYEDLIKSVKEKCNKLKINKQVIVINAMAQSGKDTFVQLFQKHYKAINFSSIDIIRNNAEALGYTGGKTEKDRKFLSDLKKLVGEYNDLPFKSMKKAYDDFMNPSNESEFLFLHIREPEEIERAKKEFNAKTLLIKNNRVDNITSNDSDKNVENYNYDFTIKNDSTLEVLEEKAIELERILHGNYKCLSKITATQDQIESLKEDIYLKIEKER